MNERNDEKMEQLLNSALKGLPLRRAPGALQARVLEQLALRSASRWWRRNFAQWPMAARIGFVVVGVLLAGLSLTSGLSQQFGTQTWAWVQPAVGMLGSIDVVASLAVSLVPPLYLYIGLLVGAMLYALLFGLGAFAYRTLYLQNSNTAMSGS